MSRATVMLLCLAPAFAAPLPERPKGDPAEWKFKLKDSKPRLGLQFGDGMRFGLEMPGEPFPDRRPEFKDKFKKLTYWNTGDSNNTVVKIGNYEYLFGRMAPKQNLWTGENGADQKIKLPGGRIGTISRMEFRLEKVLVTQHVEIVPSETGLLDTCLIFYTIKNYGDSPQKVGIRVMLDTFIGANDGVPFTIPGRTSFLTTMEEFPQKSIPDYIEAVENPVNPRDLGTIARLRLKNIRLPGVPKIEDVEKLRICRWPGNKDVRWDWEMEPMDTDPKNKDSCVALYWAWRMMNPGEERQMAFTYGLSNLEFPGGERPGATETAMALSVPNQVSTNSEFVVTAYLWRTKPGQKVTLNLVDEELVLVPGESAEKPIDGAGAKRVQVSWKLKVGPKGDYKIRATSGDSKSKPRVIEVRDPKTTHLWG